MVPFRAYFNLPYLFTGCVGHLCFLELRISQTTIPTDHHCLEKNKALKIKNNIPQDSEHILSKTLSSEENEEFGISDYMLTSLETY